jgi:hypothetical protein
MGKRVLMNGNYPVLSFDGGAGLALAAGLGTIIDQSRMPLFFKVSGNFDVSETRINEWWRRRAIPRTRDGIGRVLRENGIKGPEALLQNSYGLSLSDQYWVKASDANVHWEDVNFFQNPFDEALGEALFNVSPGLKLSAPLVESPDATSAGDLPKRWIIDSDGNRVMLKGGRTGQEPVNEVIVSRLCEDLGIEHVSYNVSKVGNRQLCSCREMLATNEELISAEDVIKSVKHANADSDYMHWLHAAQSLGADIEQVTQATENWILTDFVVRNTDRHWNNFGLIRNIETLAVRPAPLFDSGESLWNGEFDIKTGNFMARPFFAAGKRFTALRQLKLVEGWNRYDLENLSSWYDWIPAVLGEHTLLSQERITGICDGVRHQIDAAKSVARISHK